MSDQIDFDLEELLAAEAVRHPKLSRRFSEPSDTFCVAGLRKITYNLDGVVDTAIFFEGIFQSLSTEIIFLRTLRLVVELTKVEHSEPLRLLEWKEAVEPQDVLPRTMRLNDTRLLGTEERGLRFDKKDLKRISYKDGTILSRLMQATREDGLITFEWVDVNKKGND